MWEDVRPKRLCVVLMLAMAGVSPQGFAADVQRASIADDGSLAEGDSYYSVVSANGQFVVFQSQAANLVAGDKNRSQDVFLRDIRRQATTALSRSIYGGTGAGTSGEPAISSDGRVIVWESNAPDLVGDDGNGVWDVFLWDRDLDAISRVSLDAQGREASGRSGSPAISADGRYVVFESEAALVGADVNPGSDVYRLDTVSASLELVSVQADAAPAGVDSRSPEVSANGRFIAFLSTTNGAEQAELLVKDMIAGVLNPVSRNRAGAPADGKITWPAISADGRYVAFSTNATNLAQGDSGGNWDVYLHDRKTGIVRQISEGLLPVVAGAQRSSTRSPLSFSANGWYLYFHSSADDLVSGDLNQTTDVFRYDLRTNRLATVSIEDQGWILDSNCFVPSAGTGQVFTVSCETDMDVETGRPIRDIFVSGPYAPPTGSLPPKEPSTDSPLETSSGNDPFGLTPFADEGAAVTEATQEATQEATDISADVDSISPEDDAD